MEQAPSNNEASSGTSALDDGLGAAVTIPEGWQLVPKEPTQAMIRASWDCAGVSSPIDGQRRYIAVAYHAMLKAAPEAPNVELTGSGQVHRPESSEQSERG